MAALTDRLTDLVVPVFADLGLELLDIEHHGGVVRLVADREGGVDLGLLTKATRAVSAALDETDPVPGRYTLEVSSPGLERPLRTPAHYQRAIDTDVKIKTVAEIDGQRRFIGTLVSADDDGFELAILDGDRTRFAYADVDSARTVFEWGPTPKPGGRTKKREASKP